MDETNTLKEVLLNAISRGEVSRVNTTLKQFARVASWDSYIDIIAAISLSHHAETRNLCANNEIIDIKLTGPSGFTYLHSAVQLDNVDMVEMLVNLGLDVDAKSRVGITPLHLAVALASSTIVKFLLEHGADIDARDSSEQGALYIAVSLRKVDIVKLLLCYKPNMNDTSILKVASLQKGCRADEIEKLDEMIKCLLEYGFNIDGHDVARVFVNAARNNLRSLAIWLLDRGADLDTGLQVAIRWKSLRVFQALLLMQERIVDISEHVHLLHLAASSNWIYGCQIMLDHGVDVDACDHYGYTALAHVSVRNEAVIFFLLSRGAYIDAQDSNGYTILHKAGRENRADIFERLLRAGANINSLARGGLSVLHMCRHPLILEQVLALSELDVNCPSDDGQTPLHCMIAETGYFWENVSFLEMLRQFLDAGANVNAQCYTSGSSPFHCAISMKYYATVLELFVAYGADINLQTSIDGFSPLHLASNCTLIKFLLTHGADINLVDNLGRTAVEFANERERNMAEFNRFSDHDYDAYYGYYMNAIIDAIPGYADSDGFVSNYTRLPSCYLWRHIVRMIALGQNVSLANRNYVCNSTLAASYENELMIARLEIIQIERMKLTDGSSPLVLLRNRCVSERIFNELDEQTILSLKTRSSGYYTDWIQTRYPVIKQRYNLLHRGKRALACLITKSTILSEHDARASLPDELLELIVDRLCDAHIQKFVHQVDQIGCNISLHAP